MILQIVTAFTGSFGFAILFRTKRERLFFTALGGGITWCIYLFCREYVSNYFACNLIAAIGAALYGELMAGYFKTPPVVFRVPAMVPLVPGGSLYYTLSAALTRNQNLFIEKGMETIIIAFAISVGIVIVNLVCGPFRKDITEPYE